MRRRAAIGSCSPAAGRRGADSYRGGAGIDVAEYNFQPPSGRRVLRAPRRDITFDGRGNDGPAGGTDDVAADVERATRAGASGPGVATPRPPSAARRGA